MRRRKQNGFSLLEVIIASLLLVVIVGITFQVLYSAQSLYNESSIAQNLEDRGRRFFDSYKGDLIFARVNTVADDGSSMRYQIPLSTDAGGNPVYGIRYNGDQPGWQVELIFVPDNVYRENAGPDPGLAGVTSEQFSFDLNLDGDQNDTFLSGKLIQNILDAGGTVIDTSTASDFVVLQYVGPGVYDGDIDGDGQGDRLFSVLDINSAVVPAAQIQTDGVRTHVKIWHGNFSEKRTGYVLRQLQDEFTFRNSQ